MVRDTGIEPVVMLTPAELSGVLSPSVARRSDTPIAGRVDAINISPYIRRSRALFSRAFARQRRNIRPGQARFEAEFDFRQLPAARNPVVGETLNLLSPCDMGHECQPQCHGSVTTHLTQGGTRGYGTGSFSQLDGISETEGHASECLWVDWGSSGRRFKSCQPDVCDVAGHRNSRGPSLGPRFFRVGPLGSGGLVVPGGVKGEVAEDFSGGGVDDGDFEVLGEDQDAGSVVDAADADVLQAAVDAQGD